MDWNNVTNAIVSTLYIFGHNRTTTHANLDLITACYDNINNNTFSSLLVSDIKKAFDSFSNHKLIKNLEFHNIRGVAKLLLNSHLYDLGQYASINIIKSSNKIIDNGISQGSI